MAGIDKLLSESVSQSIKRKLDSGILKSVERKLFLEHGMSIKLSIEHFQQFLDVLKKNSQLDVKKFQKDVINENIELKELNGKFDVKILNDSLSELILGFLGDAESRKILASLLGQELTIPEILKKSKVPKTSGYRKIESLILNGLIIETGRVLSESKKISKYRCCFDEIKTKLNQNDCDIIGTVNKKMLEKSSSIN